MGSRGLPQDLTPSRVCGAAAGCPAGLLLSSGYSQLWGGWVEQDLNLVVCVGGSRGQEVQQYLCTAMIVGGHGWEHPTGPVTWQCMPVGSRTGVGTTF